MRFVRPTILAIILIPTVSYDPTNLSIPWFYIFLKKLGSYFRITELA
jgi:hypothetical protein